MGALQRTLAVSSLNLGLGAAAITQIAGYSDYTLVVGGLVGLGSYLGYVQRYVPSAFYQYQHAIGGASLGYLVGPSQGYSPGMSAVVGGAAFAGLSYYLGRGSY